ncbi:MAG: NTP transferase domain-containing protein [Alphaproteobacteria bacterium]|nr:NTP transferase domain-containing protein [Alphaproteobacteria bacterium]
MPKKPHIAAIVQARMKSTRLPGKVMAPVVGQPLIWHILHRLKKSGLIETICVATTRDPSDDALAAYAEAQGAKVVRGPEDDVLGRLALASYAIDPDVIVRVNADAPLVDAAYVDYLIRELMRHQADFVTLKPGLSAIHDGADVMSRWALDKLVVKAHEDPIAREHVTAYFKLHPEFVNVAAIDLPEKWRFDGARLSIDTAADVTFIEAVYARLHAQAGEATLTDLVALLTREPRLLDLNAPAQVRVAQAGGTVLMRCDGSRATGLGRVRRSLSIARALCDREGFAVRFAVRGDALGVGAVDEAGFAVDGMPADMSEIDWLLSLAETHKPCAMMLDVASDLSATSVMRLRGADMIVGVVGDLSPRRLAADASFYAPVPQVFALNWEGAEAEPHVGWEWIALAQDTLPPLAHRETRPQLIVSLADAEMTVTAVRALAQLHCAFDATVVLGLGAPRDLEARVMRFAPNFAIVHSANELPKLMGEVDLALAGADFAACELAALGVPAIYLCGNENEAVRASAFERAGMGYALHVPDEAKIAAVVNDVLADAAQRRAMSAAGRMNVDGRGAMRIAHRLKQLVDERAEALAVPDTVVERRALAVR